MELMRFGERLMTNLVMNGAGSCKSAEAVRAFARSNSGAVVYGSITCYPREGNPGRVLKDTGIYSLNSIGLKNEGAAYWEEHLPALVQDVHDHGKPFILSVAGFERSEYSALTWLACKVGADGVEFNLACPNAIDNGRRHPILGFEPELVVQVISDAEGIVDKIALPMSIGVKMPPYSNPLELIEIAEIVRASSCDFVTTMGAFPNALSFKSDGSYTIETSDGYAGLAGYAMRPIALGQIQQWKRVLGPSIPVIGAGGFSDPGQLPDYIRAGASAVQATTYVLQCAPPVFGLNYLARYRQEDVDSIR